ADRSTEEPAGLAPSRVILKVGRGIHRDPVSCTDRMTPADRKPNRNLGRARDRVREDGRAAARPADAGECRKAERAGRRAERNGGAKSPYPSRAFPAVAAPGLHA